MAPKSVLELMKHSPEYTIDELADSPVQTSPDRLFGRLAGGVPTHGDPND